MEDQSNIDRKIVRYSIYVLDNLDNFRITFWPLNSNRMGTKKQTRYPDR